MLAQFTLFLIAGLAGMLCLMPRRDVASGFFRVMMLVLLGLAVLLAMASPESRIAAAFLAAGAFLGSAVWTLERRAAGTWIVIVLGVLSAGELVRSAAARDPADIRGLWIVAHLATAGILGGATTAMLLGHRYLTAPGMPLRPLVSLNAGLGAATLIRAGVSVAALILSRQKSLDATLQTWLALRWLAGIAGPAVAVVLVWRILKYRNTQSATGVLFAAVVLAFIGELSGELLSRQVGWPL